MNHYQNLLVGLNLSDIDKTTIPYTAMISRNAKSKNTYFLHISRNHLIPQSVRKEYPNLLGQLTEFAAHKMNETVEQHFDGDPGMETHFEVVEGSPLEELLYRSQQKKIDLIVVGRKQAGKETRMLPLKLTRKAPCSVLVVPEGSQVKISGILVGTDFSECSAEAVKEAITIAKANKIAKIHVLHAFCLPIGYYKTGKTEIQFAEIMKRHAKRDYRNFVRHIDLKGIILEPLYVLNKNPANAIRKAIHQKQIDLVITGARGRTAGAAVLLGSVTERLILTTDIPLLAVKKKGACMRIINALKKL